MQITKYLLFVFTDKLKRFKLSREVSKQKVYWGHKYFKLLVTLPNKIFIYFIDIQGRIKADKNRMRVEEEYLKSNHVMRMEAAAQKKEEKRKQEKEKIM